jgi:hypothetical protein
MNCPSERKNPARAGARNRATGRTKTIDAAGFTHCAGELQDRRAAWISRRFRVAPDMAHILAGLVFEMEAAQ